ncbi:MAG: hypothetical protein U5L96_10315 [Owenweeksia sp.]|nr:hypothetical protein [Owenweeksia sp.]
MKKLLITALAISMMVACKKDKDDPRDPVPIIEVLKIGPSIVTEFKDSVVILIRYQDGDGDLGGVPADEANLFAVDNRINVPFEFRVQELVPGR